MVDERGTDSGQDDQVVEKPESRVWRKNVLALMLLVYITMFGLFLVMVLCGVNAKDAYNLISVPFVALVGGTLAVAKDLL